jgi:hypothetical protein
VKERNEGTDCVVFLTDDGFFDGRKFVPVFWPTNIPIRNLLVEIQVFRRILGEMKPVWSTVDNFAVGGVFLWDSREFNNQWYGRVLTVAIPVRDATSSASS